MGNGLLAWWRRRLASRGFAGAALCAIPVAVAALIGFETSLPGIASGLSAVTGGPDTIPASAQTEASRTSRVEPSDGGAGEQVRFLDWFASGRGIRGHRQRHGNWRLGWLRWRLVGSSTTSLPHTGGGTSGVGDTVNNTVNNTASNTVDDTVGTVNDTVGTVNDTVGTVNDTVGTVNDTVGTVGNTVDNTVDSVNNTLGGVDSTVNGLPRP